MADKPAEKSGRFRMTVTPKQGVMIALLLGVLGYMLFNSDKPATTEPEVTSETPARRSRNSVPKTVAKPTNITRAPIDIEEIVRKNPFAKIPEPAKPKQDPPQVVAPVVVPVLPDAPVAKVPNKAEIEAKKQAKELEQRTEQALAELQGSRVKMILRTENKTSAVIGNRTVTEGQVIEGIKIISILPQGVIVKRVSAEAQPVP